MQNSDSLYGFGYTFWIFWIIALHFLYKLWITNILATSITEETCIVEIRIWYKKISTVNFILMFCKKEITNSPTFQLTSVSENYICNKHKLLASSLQAEPNTMKVPTMYWLPKLHKTPYKYRFISSSSHCSTTKLSHCSTTKLSILLTSTLGTIKNLIINCSNKAFENSGINSFWSVKNSLEVLDKLHAYIGDFESVQSFDFFTVYTTLPHNLIKKKITHLIKWAFKKSECEYICSNSFRFNFGSNKQKNYVN